ncbi:MAG TPA: dihydropteroate synthase [Dehalococcoidia bacterium]|jgi:5-methyltetrahydrofolate corrinoid/iron sulfur protein methyltransferase|nr:dihydropteroate synthase [Dehalococcoidia bacterium]
MFLIGESIHVISPKVRAAIESRDKALIQELAQRQVEKGAHCLDLNIGPQKKAGTEVMPWMVETVQEVVDVPLSLDTTNVAAMEAGLQVCKKQAIINSTDATPERLHALMPLAAKYNARIIALSLAATGLPTSADARITLASENLLPAAMEYGVPYENIYLDPLVLTVNGNQDQALATVEAVRLFKQMTDPPCLTTCGLSNVSNSCPNELRSLLNRVFLVMLMGAGLDSAIADALDDELLETIRIVESRDTSTPKGQLYIDLFDTYQAGGEFDPSGVDMSNPELSDIVKTIKVFENKTLYAHGYLRL